MAKNDVTTKLVVKGDVKQAQRALRGLKGSLSALARNSGLSKVSGQLRNISRRMKGVGRQAKILARVGRTIGLGLTAGLAVAAGGSVVLAKKYAESTDEMTKFSRQIGFSLQSLRELGFVARRQGVDMSTLNSSLGAFSKRLGEMKNGGGALLTFLKKSNPELVKQLNAVKSTEEAFGLMLGAMSKSKTAPERAALAAAAFSRSGMTMSRISEAGADGIADLREQAKKYLGVMKQGAGSDAEKFKDMLENISTAATGLRDAVGGKLLPKLTELGQSLANWIAQNRDLISTKVAGTVEALGNAISAIDWVELASNISSMAASIAKFVDKTGGFKTVLIALAAISLAPLGIAVGLLAISIAKLGVAMLAIPGLGQLLLLGSALVIIGKNIGAMGPGLKQASDVWKNSESMWKAIPGVLAGVEKAFSDLQRAILVDLGEMFGFDGVKFDDKIKEVTKTVNEAFSKLAKDMFKIGVDIFNSLLAGMTSAFKDVIKAVKAFAADIAAALGGMISSAGSMGPKFKSPIVKDSGAASRFEGGRARGRTKSLLRLNSFKPDGSGSAGKNGKAEITVRFQNAPAGTVTTAKTSGKLFKGIKLDTGVAMAKA